MRSEDDPEPAAELAEALERMRWCVEPGTFCLVALPRNLGARGGLPEGLDLAALGDHAQVVLEPDEVTILATEIALEPLLARSPDARVERDLAWIRFLAPMGWEVVGFLALVGDALARAGVPIGVVCSFDRDHLFVAQRYLERARTALQGLLPGREVR